MKAFFFFCLIFLCISPSWAIVCGGEYGCLPGLTQVGVGFNVVTGYSTGLGVLQYNYGLGNSWFDPFSNTTYSFPDECTVTNKPLTSIDSFVYYKSSDYQSTLCRDSSIGVTPWATTGAAFSLSRDVTSVEQTMSSSKVAFAYLREYFTLYSIQTDLFSPTLNYTSTFLNAIDRLPYTYDKTKYSEFVDYFGTHVITSGVFGGMVQGKAYIERAYFESYSSQVASYNAKMKFLGKKNGVGPTYNHPPSSTYTYDSYGGKGMVFNYVGGLTTLSLYDYKDWINTVRKSPALVRYTLHEITEFVENPIKRANLEQYLDSYRSEHSDKGVVAMTPAPLKLKPCRCYRSSNVDCDRGHPVEVPVENSDLAVQYPFCCEMCYSWNSSDVFTVPYGTSSSDEHQGWNETRQREEIAPQQSVGGPEQVPATANVCGDTYAYAPANCGDLPCLPGIDSVAVGFDIVMDSTIGTQIFELTYNNKNMWSSPFDPEKVFMFPDQALVVSNPRVTSSYDIARSSQEVAYSSSSKNGITAPVPGYFSYNSEVQQSSSAFYGGQSIIALQKETQVLYQVSLYPYYELNLTSSFKRAVELLPTDYVKDAYSAFVKMYGTHVIINGLYGGEATLTCSIDMQYFSSHSDQEIQTSTGLLFVSFKSGQSMTSSNRELNTHSVAEFKLVGGDAAQLYLSGSRYYSEWESTIHCNPVQVQRKLLDISLLISNPAKSSNLKKYINQYASSNAVSNKKVPPSQTAATYRHATSSYPKCTDLNYAFLHTSHSYEEYFGTYYYWIGSYSCDSMGWKIGTSSVTPTSAVSGQPYQCGSSTIYSLEQNSIRYLSCPGGMFLTGFKYYQSGQGNIYSKAPLLCAYVCFDNLS